MIELMKMKTVRARCLGGPIIEGMGGFGGIEGGLSSAPPAKDSLTLRHRNDEWRRGTTWLVDKACVEFALCCCKRLKKEKSMSARNLEIKGSAGSYEASPAIRAAKAGGIGCRKRRNIVGPAIEPGAFLLVGASQGSSRGHSNPLGKHHGSFSITAHDCSLASVVRP